VTDRIAYRPILRPASNPLSVTEKSDFQSDCSPIHAMVMLLYRTLQSKLKYVTVVRRTYVMAVGSNLICIQNCGQTAAVTHSNYSLYRPV